MKFCVHFRKNTHRISFYMWRVAISEIIALNFRHIVIDIVFETPTMAVR